MIESLPTITTRWGNGLSLRTFFISLRRLRVRWRVYQLAIQFLFVLLPAVFGGWSSDIGFHHGFPYLRQFVIHLGPQPHVIFMPKNNASFWLSKNFGITLNRIRRTRFWASLHTKSGSDFTYVTANTTCRLSQLVTDRREPFVPLIVIARSSAGYWSKPNLTTQRSSI